MKAVKVLVADPVDGGCERISRLLSENPRIEVVATAKTGAECIRKTALTRPHVVTMDIQFMDMSAQMVINTLASMDVRVSVYLIGPMVTPQNPMLQQALDAGAFDYIRCSRNDGDLSTYSRQIINTIFVAGLSSAKQIPQKEGIKRAEGLDGLLRGKRVVLCSWAADRLRELPGLVTGLRIGLDADVLVVVDLPSEKVPPLLNDLTDVAGRTVQGLLRGTDLTGGRIYVTGRRKHDIVVGPGPSGRDSFQFRDRPTEDERGPNLDRLMKNLAAHYRDRVASVLVGGDGTEGVYGMKAIQDAGGVTIVDELSVELLNSIRKWLPNAKIPRAVASLENLRVLLRELS